MFWIIFCILLGIMMDVGPETSVQWCMGIYYVIYAHSKHKILKNFQNVIYAHTSSLSDRNHALGTFSYLEIGFYEVVLLSAHFLEVFWHSDAIYAQFNKYFCFSIPTSVLFWLKIHLKNVI